MIFFSESLNPAFFIRTHWSENNTSLNVVLLVNQTLSIDQCQFPKPLGWRLPYSKAEGNLLSISIASSSPLAANFIVLQTRSRLIDWSFQLGIGNSLFPFHSPKKLRSALPILASWRCFLAKGVISIGLVCDVGWVDRFAFQLWPKISSTNLPRPWCQSMRFASSYTNLTKSGISSQLAYIDSLHIPWWNRTLSIFVGRKNFCIQFIT